MNTIFVRDAVNDCDVFKGFDDEHLDFLVKNGRIKQYNEGQSIYNKGDVADGTFCLIVSGTVNIISEQYEILYAIGPGNIIGEIGTISPQSKRTITVRAAEKVDALEWDIDEIYKEMPGLFEKLRDLARKRTMNWYY